MHQVSPLTFIESLKLLSAFVAKRDRRKVRPVTFQVFLNGLLNFSKRFYGALYRVDMQKRSNRLGKHSVKRGKFSETLLIVSKYEGYFLQVQQIEVADLILLFIFISLFDRDHARQHSTTSTCYKQANVTDLVHTETTAIAGFQVLSLVIHNTLESLYIGYSI